jgi:hypothetical protein
MTSKDAVIGSALVLAIEVLTRLASITEDDGTIAFDIDGMKHTLDLMDVDVDALARDQQAARDVISRISASGPTRSAACRKRWSAMTVIRLLGRLEGAAAQKPGDANDHHDGPRPWRSFCGSRQDLDGRQLRELKEQRSKFVRLEGNGRANR